MELIHKLNGSVIEEPVGFDNLEFRIQRGNYHGMSAEVSVGTLEFYGSAYEVIKNAYDQDIDSTIAYSVTTDTGVNVYSGTLDLSTCSFQDSEYRSVSVKVGEVGAKTIFNNRTETDVDLNGTTTIDGADLEQPDWKRLTIPMKHLLYTDGERQDANKTIETSFNTPMPQFSGIFVGWPSNGNPVYQYIMIPLDNMYAQEFGTYQQPAGLLTLNDLTDVASQWACGEDYETKYGTGTTIHVDINLNASVIISRKIWNPAPSINIGFAVVANTTEGNRLSTTPIYYPASELNAAGVKKDISAHLEGDLPGGSAIWYYLQVFIASPYSMDFALEVREGSYAKLTMYDTIESEEVKADMILVHDAINVVAHAISENALSVKSSWYGSKLSKWNADTQYGGGSLKAITNGYKIRGLYTTNSFERNMPVSFRTLIESLSAQDCIGWGFSKESGAVCVRVERWDWFYKNEVILTINGANSIVRDVNASAIPTEFVIGYKKYATNDQYNSIDSIHGQRTFTSGIKAVSTSLEKTCEFIADNYAIEETRRAKYGKSETEETTYDENIFVFELVCQEELSIGGEKTLTIGHTATNAEKVGRAAELINAKLSPRHMAARWRDFLFTCPSQSDLRFTSGEINYSGSFGVIPETAISSGVQTSSLATDNITDVQKEDDNVTYNHSIVKAETITFDYPLTIAQYNAVKDNPYGLVVVNGIKGWLQDLTYKVADGTATIKLIPKYEN